MQAEGFSDAIIDRFFRPFLGGIFFDRDLNVTSRLFEFVMRCLATGQNCLPSRGIGAVGEQLARQLPPDSIHTGAACTSYDIPRAVWQIIQKPKSLQARSHLMPSTQVLGATCI